MVFAGVKRIDKPIQADSDSTSINAKAEDKVAKKVPTIDTSVKADKPTRRRKK